MPRLLLTQFAFAAALAQAAHAELPSVCSTAYADSLATAQGFRSILEMCDLHSDGYARALYRLNTLAPESTPRLALRARMENVPVERAVLEADVFFYWLQSYPPDVALKKPSELVSRMNKGFGIEQVQVLASMDPVEAELPALLIAERRGEFLKRYLIAAGVPAPLVVTSTRAPSHSNTAEGRARDRSVALRVVLLRQRAEAVK